MGEPLAPPSDIYDALERIAKTTYYVAARCWEAIGTKDVQEIGEEMAQIIEWAREQRGL